MSDFDDYGIYPEYSTVEHRDDIYLGQCFYWYDKEYFFGNPILNAAMDSIATLEFLTQAANLWQVPVLHRNNTPEEQCAEFLDAIFPNSVPYILSVGLNDYSLRIEKFLHIVHDKMIISIDVAHGHHMRVKRAVKAIKFSYPKIPLMVGSITTIEAAEDLESWGADILRVGIGVGSVCTTRQMTGVEVPQLESIMGISGVTDLTVVADGGFKHPGDILKVMLAGADLCMTGRLFMGVEGTRSIYRGMASKNVAEDFGSSYVEGTSEILPMRDYRVDPPDSLEERFIHILNGLRSGMSYINAHTINDLRNRQSSLRLI